MNARSAGQLALDLPHRPALGAGDFLVAPGNREAVAWIDRWPDWKAPGVVIHGPPGCGKSHLLEVWRARSGAAALEASELADTDPAKALGSRVDLAVEGLDDTANERVLFHLYNMVVERGGKLLMTARAAPARLKLRLPDLISRIGALPAVAVAGPDDTLLAAVLVKLFADRQLSAPPELIDYLLPRMERSFEAARRLAARLDQRALELRRPLTVPLARDVLAMDFGIDNKTGGS